MDIIDTNEELNPDNTPDTSKWSEADAGQPNMLEVLDGMEFPATKVEMVAYAEDQDAAEETLELIEALPERLYTSIRDVARHNGEIEHLPGEENLFSSEPSHDLPDDHDRAYTEMNGAGRI